MERENGLYMLVGLLELVALAGFLCGIVTVLLGQWLFRGGDADGGQEKGRA